MLVYSDVGGGCKQKNQDVPDLRAIIGNNKQGAGGNGVQRVSPAAGNGNPHGQWGGPEKSQSAVPSHAAAEPFTGGVVCCHPCSRASAPCPSQTNVTPMEGVERRVSDELTLRRTWGVNLVCYTPHTRACERHHSLSFPVADPDLSGRMGELLGLRSASTGFGTELTFVEFRKLIFAQYSNRSASVCRILRISLLQV